MRRRMEKEVAEDRELYDGSEIAWFTREIGGQDGSCRQ